MLIPVDKLMRFFFWHVTFALLNTSLASSLAQSPEAPKARLAKFHNEVEPILKRSCVGCHGPKKQKGQFRVDTLDPNLLKGKDVNWWLEVFNVISNGEMPPEDAEVDLPDKAKTKIVEWLSGEFKQLRRSAAANKDTHRFGE